MNLNGLPADLEQFVGEPYERHSARARRWRRIGFWLVVGTLAYNAAEGIIAAWAGTRANSIALLGFGLDSFIECAAAVALVWRLALQEHGTSLETLESSERRIHHFVEGTFMALACYVLAQASWALWHREMPAESVMGIALAAASLVVMPLMSWGKLHAAKVIKSAALRSEAKETLACSYLSFTLLLGLVANAAAGWWWADPVAALLMVPWLVREGLEGLHGECGETAWGA
jgi:divalent metal cation (Fe/Co/Zn/Cd) transporter